MSVSRQAATIFTAGLVVSGTMSLIRIRDDFARRTGLKGTQILELDDGSCVEFTISDDSQTEAPVIILENGLGSPLESWDWVVAVLSTKYRVIRYHRRGYARTKSCARPAQLLEALLSHLAPTGPIVFVAHSMGAVVTLNVLAESRSIRSRVSSLVFVDGTDCDLLARSRNSPRAVGDYLQMTIQETLASITGLNRWSPTKIERDVEYRPDVQKSFLTFSTTPRTLRTAYREFRHEPLCGDIESGSPFEINVIAASDNTVQQERFARRMNARFSVVPTSSHRSILGRPSTAGQLCAIIESRLSS